MNPVEQKCAKLETANRENTDNNMKNHEWAKTIDIDPNLKITQGYCILSSSK